MESQQELKTGKLVVLVVVASLAVYLPLRFFLSYECELVFICPACGMKTTTHVRYWIWDIILPLSLVCDNWRPGTIDTVAGVCDTQMQLQKVA